MDDRPSHNKDDNDIGRRRRIEIECASPSILWSLASDSGSMGSLYEVPAKLRRKFHYVGAMLTAQSRDDDDQ
jgi:hypothetical protein